MSGFIVAMRPSDDAPPEYMPRGFGYTAHAHVFDPAEAEVWPTRERAILAGNGYRWPPAFWESERKHANLMAEKFRRWRFSVEEVA